MLGQKSLTLVMYFPVGCQVADVNGQGFAEAYPHAPLYNHNNLKFDSGGDARAYLKGDVLKVQAHWNDPNSFIFIHNAITDIPRGITLNKILSDGMGDGRYLNLLVRIANLAGIHQLLSQQLIMSGPNKEHETRTDGFNEHHTPAKHAFLQCR